MICDNLGVLWQPCSGIQYMKLDFSQVINFRMVHAIKLANVDHENT